MIFLVSFQNGISDWRKNWWESFEETPLYAAIWTYLGYGLLVLVGHIRDFLRNTGIETQKAYTEPKIPVSLTIPQAQAFKISRNERNIQTKQLYQHFHFFVCNFNQ